MANEPIRLNMLADMDGATHARKRVGRGIGSGKGKTAGRGVKGQKSRSGVAIKGFEGGQMPIHMRLPKRGFNVPNRKRYAELSIATLNRAIASGKIKAGDTLDAQALVKAGVIRRAHDGVRLIGNGTLDANLDLHVAGATKGAQGIVEGAKGSVTLDTTNQARVLRDAKAKDAPAPVKAAKKAVKAVVETVSDVVEDVVDTVSGLTDDLSLIDGAGPAAVKKMAEAGITTFKQLAALSADELAALGKKAVSGEWNVQAQELLDGKAPRAKVDQKAAAKAKASKEEE